jgi:glucokinase
VTGEIYLGVDVGGTKVRAALVDEDGSLLRVAEHATRTDGGADPGMRISHSVAHRLAELAAQDGLTVAGVGVGVPEYVRDNALHSDLVMAWTIQPAQLFADIAPVAVESDVRCGALAEARFGAGRHFESLLYVSVGTGISSALVLSGSVWPGHRGEAIALGELPIARSLDAEGVSTVEEFASGSAIARRFERLTGKSVDGAREVIDRAQGQDPRAHAIANSAARALGSAVAWAVDIVDPAVVILGGGLGSSGEWWVDQVRASYLALSRPQAPAVEPAALGSNSGVIGAALVARSARGS